MTDEEILEQMNEIATRAAKEALDGVTDFLGRFEDVIIERFGRLEARMNHLEEKITEELEEHRREYRRLDGRLYRVEETVLENHEPRITTLEALAQ